MAFNKSRFQSHIGKVLLMNENCFTYALDTFQSRMGKVLLWALDKTSNQVFQARIGKVSFALIH